MAVEIEHYSVCVFQLYYHIRSTVVRLIVLVHLCGAYELAINGSFTLQCFEPSIAIEIHKQNNVQFLLGLPQIHLSP